jgi:hypothetical protein
VEVRFFSSRRWLQDIAIVKELIGSDEEDVLVLFFWEMARDHIKLVFHFYIDG